MSALGVIAAVWLVAAAPARDAPDQQAQIQAAFDAAEALQGPLDGLWRLTDAAGHTLFVFALSDPGDAPAPLAASPDHPGVEGAWRDVDRAGSPGGSGLIDGVSRHGGRLVIRFVEGQVRQTLSLSLQPGQGGRWTGALAGAGPRVQVVMTRF